MFTKSIIEKLNKELKIKPLSDEELSVLLSKYEFLSEVDLYFRVIGLENKGMKKEITNKFISFLEKSYDHFDSGNFHTSSSQVSSISFGNRPNKSDFSIFINGVREASSPFKTEFLFEINFLYKKEKEIRREYLIDLKNNTLTRKNIT